MKKEYRIFKTIGDSRYYEFYPEALTGIILGAKIKEKNEEVIRALIREREHPIRLYRASLNESEFSIDIKELE